jgi:hypothetical protein
MVQIPQLILLLYLSSRLGRDWVGIIIEGALGEGHCRPPGAREQTLETLVRQVNWESTCWVDTREFRIPLIVNSISLGE